MEAVNPMSEQPVDSAVRASLQTAQALNAQVLQPMKQLFVGKDEVIDLLGVCLLARENLFILGPPGTAKSALVQTMARRLQGSIFDYLLTQFTEPNEIFGPFDIRQLREGNLVTNTEGMLPEATFVFLDELLNANSAILNSLLMVLNERVFRRGRETRSLPTLLVVGASNKLPEDDALKALFDRFPLRVQCENVDQENLESVLRAGWNLDRPSPASEPSEVTVAQIAQLQRDLGLAAIETVRPAYSSLIQRLRKAGLEISDRRAVKLQRLVAASAFLCGRMEVHISDCWVLRYVWDHVEQQSVVEAIVESTIDEYRGQEDEGQSSLDLLLHPRANGTEVDAEQLARDVHALLDAIAATAGVAERATLKDQLGVLASQSAWIQDEQQRVHLQQLVEQAWERLES